RTLLPGWESSSDRIMPEMASTVTALFGVPWLAGLLVAAPFAAVMSTMDSFLLLISSSVVRDIYVRWINPNPSEKKTKLLTYATTFVVGITAMIAAINPPQFLQDIIVFTGSGLSTAFLIPVALALYWPRFNHQGAIAGMLAGFFSNILLYGIGSYFAGEMTAYEPFGMSPFLLGTLLSALASIFVCLATAAPDEDLVTKYFYRRVKPLSKS
ncbi:MAG: sodium transporter, partial [Planctomycetota bacterium]